MRKSFGSIVVAFEKKSFGSTVVAFEKIVASIFHISTVTPHVNHQINISLFFRQIGGGHGARRTMGTLSLPERWRPPLGKRS